MAVLQQLTTMGLAHLFIALLFGFMIICLFIRALISFLPMLSPGNPIVRFFINIVGPVYDPVYRLLPRMSVSVLDLSATIAFIFCWWAMVVMERLLLSAIPGAW